jgi:hypothetical protein
MELFGIVLRDASEILISCSILFAVVLVVGGSIVRLGPRAVQKSRVHKVLLAKWKDSPQRNVQGYVKILSLVYQVQSKT